MSSLLKFSVYAIKNFANILSKILLIGIVIVSIFVLFQSFSFNHGSDQPSVYQTVEQERKNLYLKLEAPEYKTAQGKAVVKYYQNITCSLFGEMCSEKYTEYNDQHYQKSLLGSLTKYMSLPYTNPPASGVQYVASKLDSAGFLPKAYAAEGIGFASIRSLQGIWTVLRDTAYLLIVLILVVIGFMIMFRMKINPQTVISIENAIPRIVFALIAITFSFAIAGFLIDLMYVLIGLIVSILGKAGNLNIPELQQRYIQAGPGEILNSLGNQSVGRGIFWDLPQSILTLVPILEIPFRILGSLIGLILIWPKIFNVTKDTFGKVDIKFIGTPLGVGASLDGIPSSIINSLFFIGSFPFAIAAGLLVVPLILGLLIFLTLVFIFFRIFFLLMSSYIKILFFIVLAPLMLIIEAVPGKSAFTNWLMNLISELIVFPLIVAIFLLGTLIVNASSSGNIITLPFLVGINPKSFGFIVGMWFLFMTPDFVMIVKQLIVPKPFPVSAGIGTFFGGASAGASAALGKISSIGSLAYYVKPIGGMLKPFGLDKLINTPSEPKH